jgi:hypothetical protein
MPTKTKKTIDHELLQASVSTPTNINFRAQLIYKSGAKQEFLIVAASTSAFENMRTAFLSYMNSGTPKHGFYTLFPGSIAINWQDVSSFHEWTN